jgi:hypothetical protein
MMAAGNTGRSRLALALLAAAMLTPLDSAQAAPGDPVGGEFQVNSFTTGYQGLPAVASDADGDFVVVWMSGDGDDFGVFGQRFEGGGEPTVASDFTADGRADILWRNTSTGSTVIWKMNGLVKEDAASIGAPPLVWALEGIGDTDGDRQSDIIWRNTGTGSTLIWQMNGFVKDVAGGIGVVPLVWEIQ